MSEASQQQVQILVQLRERLDLAQRAEGIARTRLRAFQELTNYFAGGYPLCSLESRRKGWNNEVTVHTYALLDRRKYPLHLGSTSYSTQSQDSATALQHWNDHLQDDHHDRLNQTGQPMHYDICPEDMVRNLLDSPFKLTCKIWEHPMDAQQRVREQLGRPSATTPPATSPTGSERGEPPKRLNSEEWPPLGLKPAAVRKLVFKDGKPGAAAHPGSGADTLV